MPMETRVSEAFGQLIGEIVGDDSYGKAQIRTSISQAYLLAMRRGKIPSREIIEKFAAGYGVSSQPLLKAAGYSYLPDDPAEAVKIALNKYRDKLSPESLARLEQVVEEVLAEELRKQDKEGG